jgi:pyruvate kinase
MEVVDGIMVARGDLGVEMLTEQVPVIQKRLIDLANMKGKTVITATQMLESMTQHTRPTRAEASDVANAILDGTDAVMLSGETASGKFPVESVKVMDSIIRNTETNFPDRIKSLYKTGNMFPEAIAVGACMAAQSIGARVIVVFTHSGFAAMLLSKLRPSVPVVAFTPSEEALRRIPLYWGATSRLISSKDIVLESGLMNEIEKSLVEEGLIKKGNSMVFVASSPFLGKPNIIRLHKVA